MARGPTNEENIKLFDTLITNWEDETVEFREATTDFDTDKIGRYVSALSNEANLADLKSGWLAGVWWKEQNQNGRWDGLR